MEWKEVFPRDTEPTARQISGYVGGRLWNQLCRAIEETYGVAPKVEYSGCSMAPGWNVKYKKGGLAICTLYPNDGFFSCMVVLTERLGPQAELLLENSDPYIKALYRKTPLGMGGKWLMVEVTTEEILRDVFHLIALKCEDAGIKPKK